MVWVRQSKQMKSFSNMSSQCVQWQLTVLLLSHAHADVIQIFTFRKLRVRSDIVHSGRLTLDQESSMFNAPPEALFVMWAIGEIKYDVQFLFRCPVFDDMRGLLFGKKSSIYDDFFFCLGNLKSFKRKRKGILFIADFICKVRERRILV